MLEIDFNNLSNSCENEMTNEIVFYQRLGQLMNLANSKYNLTVKANHQKSDRKNFTLCEKFFLKIKSICETHPFFLNALDNSIYIDAYISSIYAAFNGLSSRITSKEHLNKFKQKIQEIESNLSKLSKEDICNTSQQIRKRIKDFQENWEANKFQRLADAYYNYAEIVEKKKNFDEAKTAFSQSIEFYNTAAKKTNNESLKKMFIEYAKQTQERLNKVPSSNNLLNQACFSYKSDNHKPTENEKANNVRALLILRLKRSVSGYRPIDSITESDKAQTTAPKNVYDKHLPFKKRKIEPFPIADLNGEKESKKLLTRFKQLVKNLDPINKDPIEILNKIISKIDLLVNSWEVSNRTNKTLLILNEVKNFSENLTEFYWLPTLVKESVDIINHINKIILNLGTKPISNNAELQDSSKSPYYCTRGFFKQISSQENDVCLHRPLIKT